MRPPPPREDPSVALCPGTYGNLMGVGVSYERGTPVVSELEPPGLLRGVLPPRERIFIEFMKLDRKFKASREGSK